VGEEMDIKRASENITESSEASDTESLGHNDVKQYIPWYDEDCS
jgi:hypothetical protein